MENIEYSKALVNLLKGSVDRESQGRLWETIVNNRYAIEEYFSKIGLSLFVDETDGYAFLKQITEEETDIPRLIHRKQLTYMDSLLLLVFRKALQEFDLGSGIGKCVLNKDEIINKMNLYQSNSTNEVKQNKEIEKYINHIEDLGFIRKTKTGQSYEVLRIIRSFIDAQWLADLDKKLEEYKNYSENEE